MRTANFTIAAGESVIRPIPAYVKPPYTFLLSPGSGGTGSVYTTNDLVVSADSEWTLIDTDATGWTSGVASQYASPAGVYAPITGYKILAIGATLVSKVSLQ